MLFKKVNNLVLEDICKNAYDLSKTKWENQIEFNTYNIKENYWSEVRKKDKNSKYSTSLLSFVSINFPHKILDQKTSNNSVKGFDKILQKTYILPLSSLNTVEYDSVVNPILNEINKININNFKTIKSDYFNFSSYSEFDDDLNELQSQINVLKKQEKQELKEFYLENDIDEIKNKYYSKIASLRNKVNKIHFEFQNLMDNLKMNVQNYTQYMIDVYNHYLKNNLEKKNLYFIFDYSNDVCPPLLVHLVDFISPYYMFLTYNSQEITNPNNQKVQGYLSVVDFRDVLKLSRELHYDASDFKDVCKQHILNEIRLKKEQKQQ